MRRSFRRRPRLTLMLLALLAAAVLLRIGWDMGRQSLVASRPGALAGLDAPGAPLAEGPCTIVRAIDGQTLVARQTAGSASGGRRERDTQQPVRLLGIQVDPAHAAAARNYLDQFASRPNVRLELDKRRLDAQGRFLAYVIAGDEWLNVELVRQGWACTESAPGDSATVLRRLRRAEQEARQAKRGRWNADNNPR